MAKKKRVKRPDKITGVRSKIKKAVLRGNYIDMTHAGFRQRQRNITRPEYEYVLKNGWHEKAKDEFKVEYQSWNYSIRGKTIDE